MDRQQNCGCRLIWVVILLGAWAGFSYQLYVFTAKYYGSNISFPIWLGTQLMIWLRLAHRHDRFPQVPNGRQFPHHQAIISSYE